MIKEKNKISKIVIPAAGLGMRMLPATKMIPKEMLPLAGKPIIHHIVEEAVESGFSEIIFVIHESKHSIEKYFKKSTKLESTLEKKAYLSLLKEIKNISKFSNKIVSVIQKKPKGLGHAILCAKSLIADEPFAVMLPDMIFDADYKKFNLATMKKNFEKSGEPSLILGKAKKSEIHNYGIVKLKNKNSKNVFFPLEDIIEKPKSKLAPSSYFVAGRYIFKNEILNFLAKEKADSSGEIQLTGAISNYLKSSKIINGYLLDGNVYDCGNTTGYLMANLAFSIKDTNSKKQILNFIKKNIVQ